jgi:DNA-directed RNA polymerase subunit RPC12/RpoP
MTLEENIKSILTTCFTGFKDEFINIATYRIIEIIDNAQITEQQAIDKLHETGWLIKHDKEMTERPHGKWIKHEWGYSCSVCGESNDYAYDNNIHKFTDNYCPNCGAKMDGGEEE